MLSSYPCHQDAVLEVKRDAYLANEEERRKSVLDLYKSSISKTKHLHANLLFITRSGCSILRSICRLVTYVNPSIFNTSWQDLAIKLGYDDVDVKCFKNLRGHAYDPTELVLRYYADKKESTVGDILQSLLELNFVPALDQAQEHIDGFMNEIETEKLDIIKVPINTEIKYILKAANFKSYSPAIFKEISVATEESNYYSLKEGEIVQRSRPQAQRNHVKYCKHVLLSFASDGYSNAVKIASLLRAATNKKGLRIGVLMLCENENIIQGNPGHIIPELLSKMDCVIPVLTEGYFTALKQPNILAKLVDERYVQFIHSIMVAKFIRNRCCNIQVRPIIPSQAINNICSNQAFIHDSILSAWKSEEEVPLLVDYIIKLRRNKITL